jgi:Tfp pilus assembly pilus retraction ATPase PilT
VPKIQRTSGRTITHILMDAGVVSEDQTALGLARQRETGRRIGQTLVELGFVTEEDIGWALARQLGLPFVDVQVASLDLDMVRSFPDGMLARLEAVPLVRAEHSLSVALSDPLDGDVIALLEQTARCQVSPSVATPSSIRAALSEVLGASHEPLRIEVEAPAGRHFDVVWDRSGAAFLLFHLSKALQAAATEIHFLPGPGELRIFYRVEGGLMEAAVEPFETIYALLARLGALGGPAIDGSTMHVSGQVRCPHGDRELLLDVSLLNHDRGVAAVLGLRQRPDHAPALDELGLDRVDLAQLRAVLDESSGLVIVTGPVRSGCSTTLASLLAAAHPECTQRVIAFEARPGPPMPTGLRMVLERDAARRSWQEIVEAQNADVVALGDVLLGEDIDEVLCSAGAGRLVLVSTDWTDCFSLIEHLARRPHRRVLLANRLQAIVHQRLARMSGGAGGPSAGGVRWTPLFEVLHITEDMRETLRVGGPIVELRTRAYADGFRPLVRQIRERVAAGDLHAREARRLLS